MGRGKSGTGNSRGGGGSGFIGSRALPGVQTAGDISFSDMMAISSSNLSQASISFDRITTVLPSRGASFNIRKKSDIVSEINKAGLKRVVVNMYRDKAGQNALQRMLNAGFQIQAEYKAPKTNSRIPYRQETIIF